MSLQLAAQHLAAQGRGPDKQLVHMSPREVAGLQALAMAHGGSLTTNPDTGLPEAGALDNLLPMIIGAGLAFATGGTSLAATGGMFGLGMPATIGLGIGALETARTGNLQKGIMAGLGAYGGAGLFTGLAGSAAAGPGMAVTNPAAPQIAMEQAAQAGAQAGGIGSIVPEAAQASGIGSVVPRAAVAPSPLYIEPTDPRLLGEFARESATKYPMGLATPELGMAERAEWFATGEPFMPSNLPTEEFLRGPVKPIQVFVQSPGGPTSAQLAEGLGMGEPGYTLQDMEAYRSSLAAPAPAPAPVARAAAPAAPVFDPAAFNQAAINQDLAGAAVRVPTTTDLAFNQAAINQDIAGAATRGPSTFAERLSAMPGKDLAKYGLAAAAPVLLAPPKYAQPELDREQYRYAYSPGPVMPPTRMGDVGEYTYFRPQYTRLAMGGPVEAMSAANVYDMQNARGGVSDMGIDNSTGMQKMARGGISDLGDYSDGGRLLKGPGDGVSDSIPAMIGRKQPARLADGEFVIPARIVSELGNGSTDAGARKLYAMMDRIQKARGKTVGKGKVAKNSKAEKYLPA